MLSEDIAEDNLRAFSQNTHYLLEWNENSSNQNQIQKPSHTRPLFKPFDTKVSIESLNKFQQKKWQRKKDVLSRFQFPVVQQDDFYTDQIKFLRKMRGGQIRISKIQEIKSKGINKIVDNLTLNQQNQAFHQFLRFSSNSQLSKVVPHKFSQSTLPSILKKKHSFESKKIAMCPHPILIDTSQEKQKTVKRRNSVIIIRNAKINHFM